jgi:acyl carrier protein
VDSLLREITAAACEVLRDREIVLTLDSRFDQISGWDPMDLVSLVVEIECRLDVQFELPEIDRIATVADLVTLITAKQALTSV